MFNKLSLQDQLKIAAEQVILDAIEKGHTDKSELMAYMQSDTYKQAVLSYVKTMREAFSSI